MTSRDDGAIRETEEAAEHKSAADRLFDIRLIIGGLFLLYGVALFIAGLVDGSAAKQKASGIDINIWAGIGMALLGAFFLVWMRLRPLKAEPRGRDDASGDHGPRHS
jgi:hypothetical protein